MVPRLVRTGTLYVINSKKLIYIIIFCIEYVIGNKQYIPSLKLFKALLSDRPQWVMINYE